MTIAHSLITSSASAQATQAGGGSRTSVTRAPMKARVPPAGSLAPYLQLQRLHLIVDDKTIIQLAGNPGSAKEGILMDALDDFGRGMTAQALRSFKDAENTIQLEYWRERLSGDREVWTPSLVEQYWAHIHSLRTTFDTNPS